VKDQSTDSSTNIKHSNPGRGTILKENLKKREHKEEWIK